MSGAYESLYDMATDINDSKPSKEIDSVIFKNMKICCANSLRKKKRDKDDILLIQAFLRLKNGYFKKRGVFDYICSLFPPTIMLHSVQKYRFIDACLLFWVTV